MRKHAVMALLGHQMRMKIDRVASRRGANEAELRIGEVETVSMPGPGWRWYQSLCAGSAPRPFRRRSL